MRGDNESSRNESSGRQSETNSEANAVVKRRTFLQAAGFTTVVPAVSGLVGASSGSSSHGKQNGGSSGAADAVANGTEASRPATPNPSTTVHLGEEGLSDGDEIDPYLEQFWNDDTHVIIPGGTYSVSDRSLFNMHSCTQDALLEGEAGASVTITQPADTTHLRWYTDGANLCIRNIRFSGAVGTADNQYIDGRVEAVQPDDTIVLEEIEFPDGGNTNTRTKGMVVQPASTDTYHNGEAWFINCLLANFADNGLYADSPGRDNPSTGSTHVRGGIYRNNNIANIRLGGAGDTCKQVTSVVDGPVPVAGNDAHATRCLRISGHGDNIAVTDLDATATATDPDWVRPIDIEPQGSGDGGSGTITNTAVRNDCSDAPAIREDNAGSWSLAETLITGSGNLQNELVAAAGRNSDRARPTTERKWWPVG